MNSAASTQQGRVFCITGIRTERQHCSDQATPPRKLISQSETDSSGYLSSSSFESSREERRLKLNEQKVFQVWEKWGQQMQAPKFSTPKSPKTERKYHQRPSSLGDVSEMQSPKFSTPKSPRTAKKFHQRPSSLGDMSAITNSQPKSAIKIKKLNGEAKSKRVVIKFGSDDVQDIKASSMYKTLSDGDLNQASCVVQPVREGPVGIPSCRSVPASFDQCGRERSNSTSSSRSCGSGQSDYSDYSSLPRQRRKYDGQLSNDECSLANQVAKSCDHIYENGVCVDESMSEFLSNVNRENLESLLNFYDRVTANEVRRKQKNYEAVYY